MNCSMKFIVIICLLASIIQTTYPTTLLYSMKIRRIFTGARAALGKEDAAVCAFTVVPIISTRSRHYCEIAPLVDIREKRLLIGTIFDLRCSWTNNFWFEITTALENERAHSKGTSENPLLPLFPTINRTGMDDITFEAGYHLFPTDKLQLDFYSIVGFPTHTKVSRKDALGPFVGTRLIGLGIGGELSYSFIEELARSLIVITQSRLLHFFSRNWDPVLPCGGRIIPGDVVDLLVAIKYREKNETFETGYNPTFFLNEAIKLPDIGKERGEEFVRNGAYIKYSHLFMNSVHPISLGCGFAFNRASVLESRTYEGWLSFSIVF